MKEFTHENIRIVMGNSENENQKILDMYNKTDYIFLHLKHYPSSHLIILSNCPSNETLNYAANLCKVGTKYKQLKSLKVIYTFYNNVIATNKPGMVTFKSNRKVMEIKV